MPLCYCTYLGALAATQGLFFLYRTAEVEAWTTVAGVVAALLSLLLIVRNELAARRTAASGGRAARIATVAALVVVPPLVLAAPLPLSGRAALFYATGLALLFAVYRVARQNSMVR